MKILCTVLLSLTVIAVRSQDMPIREFTVFKILDKVSGVVVEDSSFITFRGNRTIEWRKKNGTQVRSFKVAEQVGEWEDLEQGGELVFDCMRMNENARLIVRRRENGIMITLNVSNQSQELYEFYVGGYRIVQ